MQRISTTTKAIDLYGAGKHGFKDGNLSVGILPTDLEAAWFNNVQEEVLNVIEGAGLVADGASLTQVRDAIAIMVRKQSAAIASATGSADVLIGVYAPVVPALVNGLTLYLRSAYANATTTPTFTPHDGTIAAKDIVKGNGLALVAGDIAGAGHWLKLQYDLTLDKWVLNNPATFSVLASPSGASLVGYLAAGAGAGARPVEAKLRETLSLGDYFLAGEADSTGMFNRAFDAVADGGRIDLPAGDIHITGITPQTKRVHFIGLGQGGAAGVGTRVIGTAAKVIDFGTNVKSQFSSLENMAVFASPGNTCVSIANNGIVLRDFYCDGGAIGIELLQSYLKTWENVTAYGTSFGLKIAPTGVLGSDAVNTNTFIAVATSTNSQGGVGLSITGGLNCRCNTFIGCNSEQCSNGVTGTGLVSHGLQNVFVGYWEEVCMVGIDDLDTSETIFINTYDANISTYGNKSVQIGGGLVRKAAATLDYDAATFGQSFGLGQSWQAVVRAVGTIYTNTTARPIEVTVLAQSVAAYAFLNVSINNTVAGYSSQSPQANGYMNIAFTVPPNHTYTVEMNTGAMVPATDIWKELR